MSTTASKPSKLSKYTIQKRIGGGNFADVYLVFDKDSQTQLAIKKIKTPKKQISPKILELLHSEIHVLKSIKNENIVKLYDTFRDSDYYHLVFEYCNGGDFERYLQSQESEGISEEEALSYLKQLLNGFRALHDMQVMHRDFKLENILLKDGILKIADFGFCKQTDIAATSAGTGYYMAPEIMDRNFYTNKVDIWSLGVCLYRMLFKEFPFKPKDETRVALRAKIKENNIDFYNYGGRKISLKMQNLIAGMLIEDPEKRIGWKEIYSHPILNANEPMQNLGLSGSACEILRRKDLAKEKQKFQFEMNKLEYSTNNKIFNNKDCETSLKRFAKEAEAEKSSFITPMEEYSEIKESNIEKTLTRKKKKIDKKEEEYSSENDDDKDEEILKTIKRKKDQKKKKESDYSSDEVEDEKFKKSKKKVSKYEEKKPQKIKGNSDSSSNDDEDYKLKKKQEKTNKNKEKQNKKKGFSDNEDESEEEAKKSKEKQRKPSKNEEKPNSKKSIKKEDLDDYDDYDDKKFKKNEEKPNFSKKQIKNSSSFDAEEEEAKLPPKNQEDRRFSQKSNDSLSSNKNGENQRLISKAEERDISEMVNKKAEALQLLERKYMYQRNSISIYAKILNEGFILHEGKEATFVFFLVFKKIMLLSERLARNLTEEMNIFDAEKNLFLSLLDSDFYKHLTQVNSLIKLKFLC